MPPTSTRGCRRARLSVANGCTRSSARMLARDHGVLPVVNRDDPERLVGLVTQFDLLRAHERVLVEERHRERPLALRRPALPLLGEAIR